MVLMVTHGEPFFGFAPIIHKKLCTALGILIISISPSLFALDFELVPFFAIEVGYPGQSRDDFLTIGNVDIDGYAGLRPNIILNDHFSFQPSLGLGFPSVGKVFSANEVSDLSFFVLVDFLYYFHFPTIYPYILFGLGYWGHFLSTPNEATENIVNGVEVETETKTESIFRAAANLGMGFMFLSGLKLGVLMSMEDPFGEDQVVHLWFDIDYPLFQ